MKRALPLVLTLAFVLTLSPKFSAASGQESIDEPGEDDAAPVSRVARLSFVDGDVSFLRADVEDKEWSPAVENLPLIGGDQLYTGAGARAEVQLARGSYLRLAENTALTIAELSDNQSQFEITAGTVIAHIERFATSFQRLEVDTPNSALLLNEDGVYRINIPSAEVSEVIVRTGEAEVATADGSFRVREGHKLLVETGARERIEVAADDSRDDWDRWSYDRNTTISEVNIAASPDFVRDHEVTYTSFYGASDLASYGTWTDLPTYGRCWIPKVSSDWAPYRFGQWLWIPRLGWTWLATEPWGWAPYHYGRWAFVAGLGWVWIPGFSTPYGYRASHYYRWRPALVAFFNCFISVNNYIGWYPLAPGQRWRRHDRRDHDRARLEPPDGPGRPRDGRRGINPPKNERAISIVPIEVFERRNRPRVNPVAATPDVSDRIRKEARPGLPDLAPTKAAGIPAIESFGPRTPVRVAPPREVIARPVVTRNKAQAPIAGTQPRERRVIPSRPSLTITDADVLKRRLRSNSQQEKVSSASPTNSTDASGSAAPQFRAPSREKHQIAGEPSRKDEHRKAKTQEPADPEATRVQAPPESRAPRGEDDDGRRQRPKEPVVRETTPSPEPKPRTETRPHQSPPSEPKQRTDARPQSPPDEARGTSRREAQPSRRELPPRVENKEQNRESREAKPPSEPRPAPESKAVQAPSKEERRVENRERTERRKP